MSTTHNVLKISDAFYVIFFTFLGLLLLFGETFLGIVFFCLLLVSLSFFSLFSNLKPESYNTKISYFTLFVGIVVIATTFFTHNIPLSFLESIRLVGSLAVLVWFMNAPKQLKNKTYFSMGLVILTGILSFLSIVFYFIPDKAAFLPGMNLVYSTFGHNHLAIVLLIANPLVWFLYREYQVSNPILRSILSLPLLLFPLLLVISLGRVAIAIGVIQYFFLLKQGSKSNPTATSTKHLVLLSTLIAGMLFYVILSTSFFQKFNPFCATLHLDKRLCKIIDKETRPYYWKQAFEAVKNYPVTGYGLGTFPLISTKYKQLPTVATAYAHNQFLQWFAEMGLSGGIALTGLFLYLLYTLYKVYIQAENGTFERFAIISIFSSTVNSLFDFDWSFVSVFLITLLLIALCLPRQKQKLFFVKEFNTFLGTSSLLVLAILMIVEVSIYFKRVDSAISFFPYFPFHSKLFLQHPLSEQSKNTLLELYKNSPSFLFDYSELQQPSLDSSLEIKVKQYLHEADPWQLIYQPTVIQKINASLYAEALLEITARKNLLEAAAKCCGYQFFYPEIESRNRHLTELLLLFSREKNSEKMIEVIKELYTTEPWRIKKTYILENERDLVFLYMVLQEIPLADATNLTYEPEELRKAYILGGYQSESEKEVIHIKKGEQAYQGLFKSQGSQYSAELLINFFADFAEEKSEQGREQIWKKISTLAEESSLFVEEEPILAISNHYITLAKRNFSSDVFVIKKLQSNMNMFVEQKKWREAKQVAVDLQRLAPEDYWVATQLGNVTQLQYASSGLASEKDALLNETEAAYEKCINTFEGGHFDCSKSKSKVTTISLPEAETHYRKVSDEIAKWLE